MAHSYVDYVGTGAASQTYSFGSVALLDNATVPWSTQLVVTVDGTTISSVQYTIDTTLSNLTFGAYTPANGSNIRIARSTQQTERYVDWINSTNLNQQQMNLDSDQLFFLAQEGLDNAENSIRENSAGKWDAQNKVIANVDTAVDPSDAVNFAQMTAALTGGEPTLPDGQGIIISTGNLDNFWDLNGMAGSEAKDINFYFNGLHKPADGLFYVVADNGDNLRVSLASGVTRLTTDTITIVWTKGVLSSRPSNGSVITASLADDAVTPAKISPSSPGTKMLITASNGEPEWGTPTSGHLGTSVNDIIVSTPINDLATATGDVNVGNNFLRNVANGSTGTDGVNLAQVQSLINAAYSDLETANSWAVGAVSGCWISFYRGLVSDSTDYPDDQPDPNPGIFETGQGGLMWPVVGGTVTYQGGTVSIDGTFRGTQDMDPDFVAAVNANGFGLNADRQVVSSGGRAWQPFSQVPLGSTWGGTGSSGGTSRWWHRSYQINFVRTK